MVDLFNPEDDPTADACYPDKLEMCTCIVKHEHDGKLDQCQEPVHAFRKCCEEWMPITPHCAWEEDFMPETNTADAQRISETLAGLKDTLEGSSEETATLAQDNTKCALEKAPQDEAKETAETPSNSVNSKQRTEHSKYAKGQQG